MTENMTETHLVDDAANAAFKENRMQGEDLTDDINEKLSSIWEEAKASQDYETGFDCTMSLVSKQIEGLIRMGLDAFHRWENTSRELEHIRDEYKNKESELERVRAAEEKNRATVSVRRRRKRLPHRLNFKVSIFLKLFTNPTR